MPSSKMAILTLALLLYRPLLAQDKTSEAIDAGIDWLLPITDGHLKDLEGRFKSGNPEPSQSDLALGILSLEVYALVVAGVSVENPTIKKSFELLGKMKLLKGHAQEEKRKGEGLTHTYTVACYVFALDAAISQLEDDIQLQREGKGRLRDDSSVGSEHRPRLEEAVKAIVRGQNELGVWRYDGEKDFDNSNVQFAVLALGVGAKRHIRIDNDVWLKVINHFVKCQEAEGPETKERLTLRRKEERGKKRDEVKLASKENAKEEERSLDDAKKSGKESAGKSGVGPTVSGELPEIGTEGIKVLQRGWMYQNTGGASWSMTCAGLSSLLLARENFRGKVSEDLRKSMDAAIRDGCGWLMGHWNTTQGSYYGMYSIEKVGDIGEVQKFGPNDWYAELSSHLVSVQLPDGSWAKAEADWQTAQINTAFALLVLNRATTLLTMNQTNRIMVSGKSGGNEPNDRSWVYVRELNTSIHYPSLLRAVRLNRAGSAKLLRLFQDVLENYPDEWKGELVPELASAREGTANKTARRTIEDYLVKITGYRYGDPEDYLKWYRRWQRVVQMGESKKLEHKDALIKYYKATTKSVALKKTILWAINQCKVREALPYLLEDLNNPKPLMRLAAYDYFKAFFVDFPPPFDPNGSQDVRDKQIAAIREWFERVERK